MMGRTDDVVNTLGNCGRKFGVWLAVSALILSLSGCAKQRAELSIKKAKANIEQAREWKADTFDESKGALKAAEDALKAAEQSLAGGQASAALASAGDAVKQSKQAIDSARTRYADRIREEARKAVQVARINDGDKENPELFKKAEASLQVAEEKYNKQKYEDCITASKQTIDAVDQLLAHLKNTAVNKLDELKGLVKELEKQEAEKYQPQAIVKAKENVENIEKKINVDRDYKQAIILAGSAITAAQDGIVETKKSKANLEMRNIESKIAEARADEAAIYTPDRLAAAETAYQELMANYLNNQFDTVLNLVPQLKQQVEELVTVTRIEATKDKIATVEKSIKTLKDEDVQVHLPGRVEVMEKLLEEARSYFNNNDFDTAKEKASEGLIENDRIIVAFDNLTQKTIEDAEFAVGTARQTLEKVESFFVTKPLPNVADQRIEVRRQAETTNLNAQRDSANRLLRDAKEDRSRRQFKNAIGRARQAQQIADAVTNRTFRIVAEHALLAIQDEVSELERQGARKYASRPLSQVQALVEETQRLLNEDKNRQAAEVTAKARAYVESVKQLLAQRAIEEKKRTEELLRRIEGTAPAPGIITVKHESPGGGSGNNKEAMAEMAADELRRTPLVVAQAPAGAAIGTRPEPVASDAGRNVEPATGSGPFEVGTPAASQVAGDSPDALSSENSAEAIRQRVESMLADEQRLFDIRKYQPNAIRQAREKLQESANALVAQEYLKALQAAEEAQRILLKAEQNAARAATKENLDAAADKINLAEAAGAIMFAPAQLTEAIRLYHQAEKLLARGEYLKARDVSAQALTAAEDARLYNVNKARDLASLSTRYGGWKASHPYLVEAEQKAAVAEELLDNPQTAAEGQELAKEAVKLAQMALDHARDYTFQERLDNIYRALNQALRAGANYFNVEEVKRLIAEINVARSEYCTRNFDAVEMRLKDIEAGLARVIETTPLVLEQNLKENTARLNALIEAGAEDYMAQEVDDVKTLMNRSVVDFRKRDYASSYTNLKEAIALTNRIEERLQEQVYFDSVTELFAQLDKAFRDFEGVISYNPTFLKKLVTTPHGRPAAINLTAGRATPNDFKDTVKDIYLRAIHLKPPKTQQATHEQVVLAIKYAYTAAENFQKLYLLDQVSNQDAYEIIDTAYEQIRKARELRAEVQLKLIDPQARTKVVRAEKIVNF
ncbi:MAG: hypothetical protein N2644_05935 [Candidatus Sumerlaea chitinivorans]|nr:hypothetical protein [Candidatus Sumerlaea chitinivorans]